jgi:hypothetical protein
VPLQAQVRDVAAQVGEVIAGRAKDAEVAEALRALERDMELLKRRVTGSLVAALGADGAALAGAARQEDLDVWPRSPWPDSCGQSMQCPVRPPGPGALDTVLSPAV